jgi:hypothetical protein
MENTIMAGIANVKRATMDATTEVESAILEYDLKKASMDEEYVQEFTLLGLGAAVAGTVAVFKLIDVIGDKLVRGSFEKHLVEDIQRVAEVAQDSEGNNDPRKAIDNFKKLKTALTAIAYRSGNAGRNPYNYKGMHKKYYDREIEEIGKLSDIANEIINEKKLMKKRDKKSGNTDVLKIQLDEFFKQAKIVLEIVNRASSRKEDPKKESTEEPKNETAESNNTAEE